MELSLFFIKGKPHTKGLVFRRIQDKAAAAFFHRQKLLHRRLLDRVNKAQGDWKTYCHFTDIKPFSACTQHQTGQGKHLPQG